MIVHLQFIHIISFIIMLNKMLHRLIWRMSMQFKSNSNHYQILGVPRNATQNQIKSKFYQMAKIYHPDVCKDEQAASKFAKISVAYEILSNQQKRQTYDSSNNFAQSSPKQKPTADGFSTRYRAHKQYKAQNEEDYEPYTDYDVYFKKNRKYSKPRRGADININFSISFQEAIKGVKKEVTFVQQQICKLCSDTEHPLCFACGGKGNIYHRSKRQKSQCTKCHGRGYKNDCSECDGMSYKQQQIKHIVNFERNTHNRTILRVQGLGHHGYKNSNGDLYITVFVEPSEIFKVDGNNVHSEYKIDYITAILGGKAKIKTIYGYQQIDIQPGTQSGKEIRLFNKGLLSPFSRRQGDQIINIKIKVPDTLSPKQKALLQELMMEKADSR